MSRGTSLADERHTSLPPYESRTAHIHRLSFPPADMNCVISGGVRFPFTEEAKANFDRNALRRLESGLSAYWFEPGVLGGKHRFEVVELYQSAVSQLDILIPLLSHPFGSPTFAPSSGGLRTITLRLTQLPPPDPSYLTKTAHNGRKEGRGELDDAYKGWVKSWGTGVESLWIAAGLLSRRVTLEGFVIVEEWWNVADSILQYVVRS